jgi:hypothetical protein
LRQVEAGWEHEESRGDEKFATEWKYMLQLMKYELA